MTEIPRALSTDDRLHGFRDDAQLIGRDLITKLDGIQVEHEICAYDLDAGTVTRPLRDGAGRLQLDESGEYIALEVLRGRVEVICRALAAPTVLSPPPPARDH